MFPFNTLINFYKRSCFLSFVFITSSFGFLQAQNTEIPLWSSAIPGALISENYKEATVSKEGIVEQVSKVTTPTLTVFVPENPNGTAIVICPGGGYAYLAINKEGYKVAKWLNTLGITAFVLKNRLPSDEIMKDKTIGPLQDAQEAIRFVRRNAAKWGINTQKVGVIGFSAGGHLASTLSTHYKDEVYKVTDSISARPDFSLLIYPVISMDEKITHKGSRINLLGNTPSQDLIEKYSNEKQIDAATPPTYIVHAVDDKTVPVENSIHYFLALKKNKVPCEIHFYEKGSHGFGLGNNGTSKNWTKQCEEWLVFNKYGNNEFKPGQLWLDDKGNHINAHGGGFLFYNNTYYWFGEHKTSGQEGNTAIFGVHVYSSKDIYNWKDEGIALKMSGDTTSMLQKGCVLERPKVIYNKKTKKFVMWFHHELKGQGYKAALTGVAVSDNVTGPYQYITSFRLHPKVWANNFTVEQQQKGALNYKEEIKVKQKAIDGHIMFRDFEKGQMSRDMTLFVDDDEQAYHITASEDNQTLLISKLSDDYLSVTNDYVRVFPGEANEAPAIFKKDGKYFMFSSYTTGWKPNPGRLAVSDNMMSGWKALENPCRGTDEENKTTFHSQSTYVLPVEGKKDAFIYVGDRWKPENHIEGSYVILPVQFDNGIPFLQWYDSWNLDFFDK